MKKVDRRVQKTNQALQLAFQKMTRTTSYRDITVKSLTQMAQINRKTFYLHYDSIDDFSNTFVNDIADKLLKLITEEPLADKLLEPGYIFNKIFDFFQESREFYAFMMTSVDYSFLARKVEVKLAQGFSAALYETFDISKVDAYICANFLVRNTLMLFRLYNGGQVKLSKAEFRDKLARLNSSGLSSFIDATRNVRK
ncbi:TetR/AcrR family transcriptional regulator [Companilactobacillus halodurans]|uniref:TetR/AcrR family transcriptional regulator n=1 Tax=Companilactobacillus halodurans TaxID=2584183 RepID=A0A5P0ZQV4_9LACO|nr:TetR/AcrR family transcriptional regulator [Companilactobacillus halodurans]MQS76572.1 TetR/AcrR family transcriptional regulator [Companilactobacillus halodurans]MQS98504.1 TetR/AcrR family transcriptional regulator [Companilactobacillus halodurans]